MTTSGGVSTFLVGGARSGKSSLAQRLAVASRCEVTMIVTAEVFDDEMAERVARHQAERPASWPTIEAPLDVASAILSVEPGRCVVIDCLTLWLTNLLLAGRDETQIEEAARCALVALSRHDGPVIVVSNEVGLGIVPADPLSRRFRDVQGRVNQAAAQACDRAFFVAAGQLLSLSDPTELCEELS